MSYLETLSPIFLRFLIVFSDLPFPLLKLISIIIEIGDVETKLDLPVQNTPVDAWRSSAYPPLWGESKERFHQSYFIFRKMFVCIEEFFLFCTYLLLIFCFSWYLQSRFVVIKSRLKVLMKNFLCFQTIISPIDVFILCR